MDGPRNIHVTLPSNGCKDTYPDNRAQLYKTCLAQPITFDGKWEVALKKIRLTYDWYNITSKTSFTLKIPKTDDTGKVKGAAEVLALQTLLKDNKVLSYDSVDMVLPNGHFDSVAQLLENIQSKIKSACQKEKITEAVITYEYDDIKERVWLKGDRAVIAITSESEEHFNSLGFFIPNHGNIVIPSKGEKAPTITGCPDVFVYSNACGYRPIGVSLAQLLDHVPSR